MPKFFEPDLGEVRDSPFARDAGGKLIRRSYCSRLGDDQRYRRQSDKRPKEGSSSRSASRTYNRSGVRAGNSASGTVTATTDPTDHRIDRRLRRQEPRFEAPER